jgi:flagellar hook protein FlgE
MMRGMYAAISGLEAHQTMLDVTANNLANVDTIGYKAQRTTFVDELSQTMAVGTGPNGTTGGTNPKQVGLGVEVGSIDNLMSAGSLQSTGNALDIAIQGDGFIQVGDGNPGSSSAPSGVQYTRAGNLTLNTAGYLTNQSGQYVVGAAAAGASGAPSYINVPPGSTDVAIGQDGSVSYVDQNPAHSTVGQRVTAGYIQLASFPNESGLQRDGGSNWSATAASGAPTVATPGTNGKGQTIAGSLEMSNVDLATEFTNMITAERGYEANSKVITTADEMLQAVVNMPQG